jgi:cellulose synthase/poly-beta-1,6-N-acetylglucosamine synthase-like glycosyltransferase
LPPVRVVEVTGEEAVRQLERSILRLSQQFPDLTADRVLTRGQKLSVFVVLGLIALAAIFDAVSTAIGLLSVAVALYLAVVINRIVLFVKSRRRGTVVEVTDEEALSYPADRLPLYTILVPAYREPEVIADLLANLGQMVYPADKLDVKIVLEGDDHATLAAIRDSQPGDAFEVLLVPPAEPRTKPKALNFALGSSRGEIVTIYDAEDKPDPLQLRRAAIALARSGPDVACVQAKLSFSNVEQNLITKWFTIEYAMWFSLFLPGLASLRSPIPLGGTSNHFRRPVLEELGAWDPHNVTEDADLGIRMARMGYRCGVLDSVTYEEANSDFVNWVKQRSRWYKGYLQTALIHLRQPRRLWREVGPVGVAEILLFVLGTPLLATLNPLFWLLNVAWFVGRPHIIKELFPAPIYYVGTLLWVVGNFLIAYMTVLTCRYMKRFDLIWAALLVPLYWGMMAVAGVKAFWQLFVTPTLWEKTTHGLDDRLPRPT